MLMLAGFSFYSTILSLLLLSSIQFIILNAHQDITQLLYRYRLQYQAAIIAHNELENFTIGQSAKCIQSLPARWACYLNVSSANNQCQLVTVKVISPAGDEILFKRWYCLPLLPSARHEQLTLER